MTRPKNRPAPVAEILAVPHEEIRVLVIEKSPVPLFDESVVVLLEQGHRVLNPERVLMVRPGTVVALVVAR